LREELPGSLITEFDEGLEQPAVKNTHLKKVFILKRFFSLS